MGADASSAAIVIVGNEILTGKTEEQNARFLSRELHALGTPLRRVLVVEDTVPEIAWAVNEARRVARVVLTSGGIGPTHDDVTVQGVAAALGTSVVRHPELERRIRAYLASARPDAAEAELQAALKMAEVPEGAELHLAEGMTWPVVSVQEIYIFPGIPSVLRKKWAAVRERFRQAPFHLAEVYLTVDEHRVAAQIADVPQRFAEIAVGSYPDVESAEFKVKVTLEGKDAARLEEALGCLLAGLDARDVWKVTRPVPAR